MADECKDLPPGFRFHPTDEEIITHYLSAKVLNHSFSARAIGEVDLNKCEPWDLPSKAKMGEKEWYFFSHKDRKYPTGMRTNRATEAGYWKATGKDKEIFKGRGVLVGMKKTLVFYRGRAPKGEKTNWVMHEFRLEGRTPLQHLSRSSKDEWVVCRVFHKSNGIKKSTVTEEFLDPPTWPPVMDPLYNSMARPTSGFITCGAEERFDYKGMNSSFSSLLAMEEPQAQSISHMNPYDLAQIPVYHQHQHHPQIAPLNPCFGLPGPASSGYLHQDNAMGRALAAATEASSALLRQCKVEQLSNQSIISQDTGLSTDHNNNIEISSMVSNSKLPYDDLNDPSSSGPVMDLEDMWKY